MLRILLTTALVLGAGSLLRLPAAAQAGQQQAASGGAMRAAPAGHDDRVAIDDAIQGSVATAISKQFAPVTVTVQFAAIDSTPAGIEQRDISGRGRLRLGDDSAWIPFRVRALYDVREATTGAPQLVLGDDRPAALLATGSPLARRLDDAVASHMREEFAQQHVGLTLADVHCAPVGGHYLALQARGRADFGDDGRVETDVRALYDTRSGQWLRVDYLLGGDSNTDPTGRALAQG